VLTGFSPGGIVLLSVMAASSSDISGPPTLRAGIPSANPSAYVGASTSVGTPVAIVSDSFANIKIEIITADPEVAKRIADEVAAKYFDNYSGITYLDQVEVHRLNKFRSPTG
jgi:hypothetical protein